MGSNFHRIFKKDPVKPDFLTWFSSIWENNKKIWKKHGFLTGFLGLIIIQFWKKKSCLTGFWDKISLLRSEITPPHNQVNFGPPYSVFFVYFCSLWVAIHKLWIFCLVSMPKYEICNTIKQETLSTTFGNAKKPSI